MKNLTARITKILSAILLIFSMLFATAFSDALTSNVYADEDDEPGNNIQIDNEPNDEPGNNINIDNNDTDPSNNIQIDDDPGNNIQVDDDPGNNIQVDDPPNTCEDQVGSLAWIVCPSTGVIAKFVDAIYNVVDGLSVVPPMSMEDSSPIYLVWQYARNITNIVFVIFLLIVIYSQLTSIGLNNYGVKRILPRLIIAVVMVNLSFIFCSLAVDLSNIIGSNLREFFASIQETIIANGNASPIANVPIGEIVTSIIAGTGIAGIAIGATGGFATLFWMLIPVLLGAVVAVISGLLTIAARQALVALLVMISPLAFVAYLLPNTERWFAKWKDLLFRMLIFYPMFSLLFGASQLAGWALITSANDGFGLILGIAVQIFPLVFSWSLMKMSGTILGSLNAGLRRLAAPAERGIAGWSLSHKELNRQRYLANSAMPGAKLRRYLDYRRELRELDTKNSIDIRHGKAHERAMITAASSTGLDEEGNDTWEQRANRYTVNAKRASLYQTRMGVADAAYRNTLTAYGRHFAGTGAARLSDAHGEAYLETMKQQFLTANEAQADQDYLLGRYIQAMNDSTDKPYQYNRLIKGAAGGLGYLGTSSIMGQVIQGNANIEARRRKEGRIMINKFGMEKHKQQFRAMEFDWKNMGDDGFARDDRGNRLEDDEYNIIVPPEILAGVPESERARVSEEYRKRIREEYRYPHYFGVHKKTGVEITKEEYDALDEESRKQYQKVKYLHLTDDKNKVVQTIFDSDAGYMKELIIDDINIADPINRRYVTEIGVAKNNGEKDGIVRKYHSTIRGAIDQSHFSTHAPGITAMLTSAANAGYIRSMSDYYFILAQSLAVASKPGNFHKSDKFFIEEAHRLAKAISEPEEFAKLYKDDEIMGIVDNNGIPIKGMKQVTDEDGNPKWAEVSLHELAEMDTAQAIEYKKNFIKHGQLAKTLTTLVGHFGRPMSQDALASLKPGALPAMKEMLKTLTAVGIHNLDQNIPFEERLDGTKNIFATPNGKDLYRDVLATQQLLQQLYDLDENNNPIPPNGNGSNNRPSSSSGRYDDTLAQLTRAAEANRRYEEENNPAIIESIIEECFTDARTNHSVDLLCHDLLGYFEEIESLRPYYEECQEIIERITGLPHADREDFIRQITHPYDTFEASQIDEMYPEIIELLNRAFGSR